jgi:predicted HAD superfamily Cof-like phosphohydrolase
MSTNWPLDIEDMHHKYNVHSAVSKMDVEKLKALLKFRISFLEEELNELKDANSAEDVVDALIDLCVVAIGTLDIFNVDPYTAWDKVHKANMNKEVGIKESRPNPLGLPDLIKPAGWEPPNHFPNYGLLNKLF